MAGRQLLALLCPQEGEHGEDAAVVVGGGVQVELGEDAVHVASTVLRLRNSARRWPGWSGPRPSARAPRAPARQLLERVAGASPADELRDDLGVDDRPAGGDAAHGVDQLTNVGDAVLE